MAFVMNANVGASMTEKSSKPVRSESMTAAVTAMDVARQRVEILAMPRGWHDTKESRRARAARLIGTTARRVRAILSGEKVRLTADEYFAIETAWARANRSLASISNLARDAEIRAGAAFGGSGEARDGSGEPADREARRATGTTPPARG